MGITRIANVTGLDTIGIPVVMVCRPNSRSVSVSQGKGLTLAAAKASGVMESVEGYHAEHITLPLKYSSYEELRYSHRVADPEDLPQTRNSLFHPNLSMLWIETHDLTTQEPVWLPYELAHLNFTLPDPPGSGCFVVSANGLASGNHWLEAISHAICEVVERDAATLWSLQGEAHQQATRVDLNSVDDPDCRHVLKIFENAGVAVGVWDMTTEIGLPVFACLIVERERNPLRPLPSGLLFGCHPVREIALLRALTEAAQERLALISGSRDDLYWNFYEFHGNWEHWEKQRDLLLETSAPRRFADAPTFRGDTLLADVQWELERLHAAGFKQVLALDLTKPEFGLPVARVVIPGLEPKFRDHNYRPGKRARAIMS
jgi:YcaO-like protein with predicted kinase domain